MITILSGVRGDTRRYRTLHLYEQLRLLGADCLLSHLTDPHLGEKMQAADLVVLHRVAYDDYVARLLAPLQARNALVVLDADDFLYDPAIMRWIDSPDFQDPVRAGLYRRELLRHRTTLDHCAAITVSTDYLAGMMAPFNRPVRVHRNAFSLEMLALSNAAFQERAVRRADREVADRLVIGYASGTRTHDRDFALIQPALCEVLGRYPQAELWLMGDIDAGEAWGSLRGQVKNFPRVPWRALPARLAQLDINLAPLVPESPFNQAKSEIKFMEAALVGVPTIASRTDAFAYAIRPGQNGLLAQSPAEWQAALEHLAVDTAAREALGATARQDVLANYAPWVRGAQFLQVLGDLARQTGKTAPAFAAVAEGNAPGTFMPTPTALEHFYFSAADEAHPTMLELAGYSIRHRGAQTLLGQVWVYFRRKIAPIIPFRGVDKP